MERNVSIPIRVKILSLVLLVLILVVGLITTTMANLFHKDKTTYVRDLTAHTLEHVLEETDSILESYLVGLMLFADTVYDASITPNRKAEAVTRLFQRHADFVAVGSFDDPDNPVTVYDERAFSADGVTHQDLVDRIVAEPLPLEAIDAGAIHVRNATLDEGLPLLFVAMIYDDPVRGRHRVGGWIRLDRLMALSQRPSAFETTLFDSQSRVVAAADPGRVVSREAVAYIPERPAAAGSGRVGTTVELERDGRRYLAGFMQTSVGNLVTAVLIPVEAAYLSGAALMQNLLFVAGALFVVAAVLGIWFSRRLTVPLERLSEAAFAVGKGEFDVNVQAASRDEIGLVSSSFNQMTRELKTREAALKDAQEALIQSEKMAAFGQIGAGIAHEVKNPLAGILGYAQLAMRKIGDDDPLRQKLEVIERETRRCTEIIGNLMKFARQETSAKHEVDLSKVVADALEIVDHQLTVNGIEIETHLDPALPRVMANANQLQQVVMNFAINAQQAMAEGDGRLIVTTAAADSGEVVLTIRDTGPGIPADIRDKIFEPFFTTKPAGKGTGLGLSVTYGIIKDHEGQIQVASEPGEGTAFEVILPAIRPAADGQAA